MRIVNFYWQLGIQCQYSFICTFVEHGLCTIHFHLLRFFLIYQYNMSNFFFNFLKTFFGTELLVAAETGNIRRKKIDLLQGFRGLLFSALEFDQYFLIQCRVMIYKVNWNGDMVKFCVFFTSFLRRCLWEETLLIKLFWPQLVMLQQVGHPGLVASSCCYLLDFSNNSTICSIQSCSHKSRHYLNVANQVLTQDGHRTLFSCIWIMMWLSLV